MDALTGLFVFLLSFSAIYLCGSGVLYLAEFYQSIGIINQAYDLKAMDLCIIKYGCYCVVIATIIFIEVFKFDKK